jgi:hypothetical protein
MLGEAIMSQSAQKAMFPQLDAGFSLVDTTTSLNIAAASPTQGEKHSAGGFGHPDGL